MIDDEGKLAVKMPFCIYLPVQLYPSPSKPRLQAQTGRLPLCWQNAFGPQDGEHEGKTAEKKEEEIRTYGNNKTTTKDNLFKQQNAITCAVFSIAFKTSRTPTDIRSLRVRA